MKRPKPRRRHKHGLAWRATAGAIRTLIELSGESYVAYRQMRERVRAKQASSDRRNRMQPRPEIKTDSAASVRCLDTTAASDAVLVLVGLGYRRSVAEGAIRIARENTTQAATAAELIKLGLKNISRLI